MTRAHTCIGCFLAWALLSSASAAQAQGNSVLLVFEPSTPHNTRESVASTLASEFSIAPTGPYVEAASQQGLDPISDEAFVALVAQQRVSCAVYVQTQGTALYVEIRPGDRGQVASSLQVPANGGVLTPAGRSSLLDATRPYRSTPVAEAGDGGWGETVPDDGSAPDTDFDEEDDEEDGDPGFAWELEGGVGVGMRDARWPTPAGVARLSTGPFLAMTVASGLSLGPNEGWRWVLEARYRRSLAASIEQTDPTFPPRPMKVVAQSFEAGLAPTLGFGSGFALSLRMGFAARNLRPEVHHLNTPTYTLAGPYFRPGLRIPFGSAVALILQPEAQWIAAVGDGLTEQGTAAMGLAVGGEAWLAVQLTASLQARLGYRYTWALIAGDGDVDAVDVQQFGLATLWGAL